MMPEEKIKTAILEYINRARNVFLQGHLPHKNDRDCCIDCPSCGKERALECSHGAWYCRWTSCNFKLPADIAPPSPEELASVFLYEEVLTLKRRVDNFVNSYRQNN